MTSSSDCARPQVNLEKPLGVKFARGNDGGCFVISSDPRRGSVDPKFEVGDKIIEIRSDEQLFSPAPPPFERGGAHAPEDLNCDARRR